MCGPLGGGRRWRVRGLGARWTIKTDHTRPANVWAVHHHSAGVGLEGGQEDRDGGRKTVNFGDKCPKRTAAVRGDHPLFWIECIQKRGGWGGGTKNPCNCPSSLPLLPLPSAAPLVTDDERLPGFLSLGAETVTSSKGDSPEWISLVGVSQPTAGSLSNWWNPISILEGFPPQEQ